GETVPFGRLPRIRSPAWPGGCGAKSPQSLLLHRLHRGIRLRRSKRRDGATADARSLAQTRASLSRNDWPHREGLEAGLSEGRGSTQGRSKRALDLDRRRRVRSVEHVRWADSDANVSEAGQRRTPL